MLKQCAVAVLAGFWLSGCASMLTHYNFSDDIVKVNAKALAAAMTCVDMGLASGETVYAHGYAVSQLLSVSVYNKALYETSYQENRALAKSDFQNSPSVAATLCSKIQSEFPTMTQNVLRQYNAISQERRQELVGLSRSASSFGSNMASFTPPIAPAPVTATFGPPVNKPTHYLVDFGKGQRMCTATSSGFVYCN